MRHVQVFAVVALLCSTAGPLAAQQDTPLLIEGRLSKDDPRDPLHKASAHKVHEVKLEAGKCYQIDLSSNDFDPFLRLEDAQKTLLGFNDDIDYAAKNLDARLCFAPLRTATYRLLVTSYEGGATGAYRLRVQALAESGKPAVEHRCLDKEARLVKGRYFELRPLPLAADEVQVVEVASKEFAPRLLLLDDTGKPVRDGVVTQQGKGVTRLAVGAGWLARYRVVVTTAAEAESGAYAWRVQTYRMAGGVVAGKAKRDKAAVDAAFAHAEGLKKQGRLAEAVAAYEKVVLLAQEVFGAEELNTAILMNNLANLYRQQGEYARAESLYQRSLTLRERRLGKDHPQLATALNNLAGLYRVQGRFSKAEALFLRSLAISERQLGKGHPDVATSLNNLAVLYREQGQYGKAEPLLQRSLAIWESKLGKDHPLVATCLNNLALLYKDQGQYGKAEPLYQRSLVIRERQLGKDHPDVATTLNNLATLYQGQEQYGKAEPLYLQSLAIRESKLGKDHPDVAESLNNLALLYTQQGQYGKAEPLLLRSLEILEARLGKNHPNIASCLNNLALLYHRQGRYDRVEALYRRSLTMRASRLGESHPDAAESLINLASLHAAREHWGPASEAFDRARRSMRLYLGRELTALPELAQLAFLRTQVAMPYQGALSLGWRQRDQQALRRASATWLLNGQALAQEALGQQTLLQRDSAGQPWAPLASELHEVRGQLAALAMQFPSAAAADARRRLLDELGQREQDLAKRVAQLSGRDPRASSWLGLDELRKALPSDGVLILLARFDVFDFQATGKQPRWQPTRYAAWLIDAKDVHLVDLGEAATLETEVAILARELRAARALELIRSEGEPDAAKLLRRHLGTVAKRVLQPLLPHVKDKARWVVCPDGALWLLPWAALPLPDGKYVVERHTVSYLVSGRDVFPVESKAKPSPPVVLADPDFDLTPDKKAAGKAVPSDDGDAAATRSVPLGPVRFGRLPGTAAEARRIAPQLRVYAGEAAKVYTGPEATEAAFKVLKGPKVLVLATHGFFLPDVEHTPDDDWRREGPKRLVKPEENPLLRSGLALAGANQREPASKRGADDGILTALEILGTDLRGTELVVLSACETGLGKVRNGEGVAGLRQAFQLAGAQSVLATLWQIPDRQTAQLMGKFFDHLAAGRDRAEALRLAQLEMIRARRQREGAAHPFYWAAFTLTGNWR